MLIEPAHSRVLVKNATTAIRLQAVLVRVNHNRVDRVQSIVSGPRLGVQVIDQDEVAAVSRVGVQAESVSLPELQDLRKGVN